jgi:hypothetical protein
MRWHGATTLALLLGVALGLTGCTTPFEVVRLPKRDAEVYPASQSLERVAVAVDAIARKHRAANYFGAPLPEAGVLPVNITISNHGDQPVQVHPADLLLNYAGQVVDPLPLAKVAQRIRRLHGGVEEQTAREIDRYLEQVSFGDRIVGTGETYQGVVFFDTRRQEAETFRHVRVFRVFDSAGYRLHLRVTQMDSRDRLAFGPFSLVGMP